MKPVRLCAETKPKKWDLLKRINSLKKDRIFARLDLDAEEREEDFCLRKELRELKEAHQNSGRQFKIRNKSIIEIKK